MSGQSAPNDLVDVSKIIEGLSSPMRVALTCSHRGRVWAPRMTTIEALVRRGLADDFEHTPDGLAVHDELIRRMKCERATPESAQAHAEADGEPAGEPSL